MKLMRVDPLDQEKPAILGGEVELGVVIGKKAQYVSEAETILQAIAS